MPGKVRRGLAPLQEQGPSSGHLRLPYPPPSSRETPWGGAFGIIFQQDTWARIQLSATELAREAQHPGSNLGPTH